MLPLNKYLVKFQNIVFRNHLEQIKYYIKIGEALAGFGEISDFSGVQPELV